MEWGSDVENNKKTNCDFAVATTTGANPVSGTWSCENLSVHIYRNFTASRNEFHLSDSEAGGLFNLFGFVASYTDSGYTDTAKFTVGGMVNSTDVIFKAYLDKREADAGAI